MPRDDQTFFADMAASDQAFRAATAENMGLAMGMAVTEEAVMSRLARFQYYYDYFHDLGRISTGTEPVIARIELEILPRLEKYLLANNEGPVQVIRGKLEDWQGPADSASYKFKWNYLPPLATALENQYSTMAAMASVLVTHEGVIDQARQKYLDLVGNTTRAIDENAAVQRQSSTAPNVSSVVASIATGIGVGTGVAGPAGAVAGAAFGVLQLVGPTIDAALSAPAGDDWFTITSDALDQLEALVTAVEEETHSVASALDEVLGYVTGDYRDEYLAPPVNTGGPAPDEGWVPPTS